VVYPWEDDACDIQSLSGVPPHVCQMVHMQRLLTFAKQFKAGWRDNLKETTNELFDDRNIANASISEERVRRIVAEVTNLSTVAWRRL